MNNSFSESYKAAGVDVTAGYKSVELMKKHVARTKIDCVISGIGGFGGLFAPDFKDMEEPVLVSGTDGVGTKIKLAYSGCNGATIVNKDLITATVVDTDSDIKLLTTAQMKDTDYLTNTAEFPVFEV